MMKLVLAITLLPSYALAHPGHHDGESVAHPGNDVLVLMLCALAALAVYRVTRMVRK